jgi:hypothetical protein
MEDFDHDRVARCCHREGHVNTLQEVLDGEEGPLDLRRVREATAAALHSLRNDRRLERLDFAQARDLGMHLFHTPDIRILARYTPQRPVPKEDLEEQGRYVNQMLFEVVDEASLEHEGVRRLQRIATARGGQMRIAEVPFRLHVYNRRFAMIAADFDASTGGAIAVREPELIATLTDLHARLWQQGRKWEGASRSGIDLADVLAELLAGGTDESSAQRLHTSLRTYRRMVQELLGLLGTHSRFQAGAVAQERRYLDLVRPGSRPLAAAPDPYAEALSGVRSQSG